MYSSGADFKGLQLAAKIVRALVDEFASTSDLSAGLTVPELLEVKKDFVLGRSGPSSSVCGLKLSAIIALSQLQHLYSLTAALDVILTAGDTGPAGGAKISMSESDVVHVVMAAAEVATHFTSLRRCNVLFCFLGF
jgi:hypothetical protein